MTLDGVQSFAGAENTTQVADALAESSLAIERADWNSIDAEDLVQLLDARRTISGLALKYRQNANATDYDEAEPPATPAEVLADVLQLIWGRNPQAPVEELSSEYLIEKLAVSWGNDVVADAIERTGWDVDVPEVEGGRDG